MHKILDPACGTRMMWFNKHNSDVIFGDIRQEEISVTDNSRGNSSGRRTLQIQPDTLMDFRALPFSSETFNLVVFDPPHLVQAGPKSWLAAKYGKLGDDWRNDISAGFSECLRVLQNNGVLIFKWNETQVKTNEVIALAPIKPLFGHISGARAKTHWLVFMKGVSQS